MTNKLQEILDKSSDSYYNTGFSYSLSIDEVKYLRNLGFEIEDPEVTDELFDLLSLENKKLRQLGNQNDSNTPETIGAPIRASDSRKTILPIHLPSLEECKEEQLGSWANTAYRKFGLDNVWADKYGDDMNNFVYMPKLDGISFLLRYEGGMLTGAFTRGDGKVGQDMLSLAQSIRDIPNVLTVDDCLFIRGELILLKDESIKAKIETEAGVKFKNLRNTVAGQINSKKPTKAFLEEVHFVAYRAYAFEKTSVTAPFANVAFEDVSAYNTFEILKNQNIRCVPVIKVSLSDLESDKFLQQEVKTYKNNYKYECDGIVVTVNRFTNDLYNPISETNPNPVGVRKYKLTGEDESVLAEVTQVEWRIAKSGYIKPRIHIKPIELGGVTVTHTTGFNYAYIKENNIGVGTQIKIKRAGDVIPHIVEIVKSTQADMPKIPYVTCGVDIKIQGDDEEQAIKQLCYCLALFKIEQAGEISVRKLWQGGIRSLFYILEGSNEVVKILGVNGWKLLHSMKKVFIYDGVEPEKLLAGLGIFGRGVGVAVIKSILDKASLKTLMPNTSWERCKASLRQIDMQFLMSVDGVSNITATKILSNLDKAMWICEVAKTAGYTIKKPSSVDNGLGHLKVVFTGFRDSVLEKGFILAGATVLSSFTKQCNLVVARDVNANSSKLQKARENGIQIIDIIQAHQLLEKAHAN